MDFDEDFPSFERWESGGSLLQVDGAGHDCIHGTKLGQIARN